MHDHIQTKTRRLSQHIKCNEMGEINLTQFVWYSILDYKVLDISLTTVCE